MVENFYDIEAGQEFTNIDEFTEMFKFLQKVVEVDEFETSDPNLQGKMIIKTKQKAKA